MVLTQFCSNLCNPVNYSWPGSSVHGILQERILEWVLISHSPGDFLNRGVELRFPPLQSDSLQSEPPGKPILNAIKMKRITCIEKKCFNTHVVSDLQ